MCRHLRNWIHNIVESILFFHAIESKTASGFLLGFPSHGFNFNFKIFKIKYPPIHMETQTFSVLDLLNSIYVDNRTGRYNLAQQTQV